MPVLAKPASSAESTCLIKWDLHHIVEETSGKILGVGENQADLGLVSLANGKGTATRRTRQLAFDGFWQGDSASQYALVHVSFSYVSVFRGLRRRTNNVRVPYAITDVKRAWVRKYTLRIPSRLQFYTCCTITTSFAEDYVHIGVFSEYAVLHFITDLQSNYDTERIAFDCTHSSHEINA
jgi:hypothetical protein